MDLNPSPPALAGWSPIRVGWDGPRPAVDWCLTEGVQFTDPFFTQTIEDCLRHPGRLLFRRETDMEELGRFVTANPGLTPAGFVFHMSRCGSTLVAQMLAASPRHLVLSEAGPIDAVLRSRWSRPDVTDDDRGTWLRWMVGALGQPRNDRQQRLFAKLDSWSVIDLPLIRRAFPDVPWLFLYRDPVEVLASHANHRGAHVIPGVLPPALVGMSPAEIASSPPVDYQARVLARICEVALDHGDDPRATFVECGQLPGFVVTDLPEIWSIASSPGDADRMLQVAARDAKNPAIPFSARSRTAPAGPALHAAADRWLMPLYDRLQSARARQEQRRGAVDAR